MMSHARGRSTSAGVAGRLGGKIGGKRRLVTMTKAKRVHLAYIAGLQGGAPIRIDHEQVRALRATF